MNNKIKAIVIFAILLIIIPSTVTASNYLTQNVFKLEEEKSISIHALWDGEKPDIELLSPDGRVFDITGDLEDDAKMVIYVINDAPKGQWGAKYDKKDNKYIDMYYEDHPYIINSEESLVDKESEAGKGNTLILFSIVTIGTITAFSIIVGMFLHYNKKKNNQKNNQ